jgi:hypothetical protein
MDINSWLWLVSDLRGNIESPDFYLNNNGEDVKEATENLLLTQGWRRYRWEEILNKRQPQLDYVPEYDGQIINARIIERKQERSCSKYTGLSFHTRRKVQAEYRDQQPKGELRFEVKRFYGPGEFWYCRQMAGLIVSTGLTL